MQVLRLRAPFCGGAKRVDHCPAAVMQAWDWNIVIDEHTDEQGWTYGGCGFAELFQHRMSLRRY